MSNPDPVEPSARRHLLRGHPRRAGVLIAVIVASVVAIVVWFQPQALFFDRVVDEEFPVGAPVTSQPVGDAIDDDMDEDMADGSMTDDMDEMEEMEEESMGPVALSSGSFESRNRYTVEGTATIFRLEDGSRVLRLEDFSSTNGPDLYVYLTSADSAQSDQDLDGDFVDLGLLTGNIGNQNYVIGDDVDLDRYDTVVIWCRRFTVGFGAADLSPIR